MKKLTIILAAIATAALIGPAIADAIGPEQGKTPVLEYVLAPDGGVVAKRGTATGEQYVSGTVTMQGTTADGGLATPRLDGDKRQVVALGTITGACLGVDLTTASAAGPTIPAGAEYRLCAMASDVWVRYDGEAATADVPSEPIFARTCILVGPYGAQRTTTAILPAGATVSAGKELVACPKTRPQ